MPALSNQPLRRSATPPLARGGAKASCNVMQLPGRDESEIVGQWLWQNGKMIADAPCERIQWLTEMYLVKIGTSDGGWSTLYRDPREGRLWEKTYPNSDWHGGGPPRLAVMTPDVASLKYPESTPSLNGLI